MATRSTIALEFADGTVQQVYCHWDGYLSHNGSILLENYSDPFKLRDLIDLGGLSILGEEIGVKHDFNGPTFGTPEWDLYKKQYGNMCKFYSRDRGEDLDVRKFSNFDAYKQDAYFEEYDYILRTDGKWYFSEHGSEFTELTKEMVGE